MVLYNSATAIGSGWLTNQHQDMEVWIYFIGAHQSIADTHTALISSHIFMQYTKIFLNYFCSYRREYITS